jgi:hypothetical protein
MGKQEQEQKKEATMDLVGMVPSIWEEDYGF